MKLSIQNLRRRSSHLRRVCFAILTSLLLTDLIPPAGTGIFCMSDCGGNGEIFRINPDENQLRRFTNILNTTVYLLVP